MSSNGIPPEWRDRFDKHYASGKDSPVDGRIKRPTKREEALRIVESMTPDERGDCFADLGKLYDKTGRARG